MSGLLGSTSLSPWAVSSALMDLNTTHVLTTAVISSSVFPPHFKLVYSTVYLSSPLGEPTDMSKAISAEPPS